MNETVTINLDPPYIFVVEDNGCTMTPISEQQLRTCLQELGVEQWPLRDCVIRLQRRLTMAEKNNWFTLK